MDFLRAASLDDALTTKAQRPDITPIAGGTDLMVGINFDHTRPSGLLDLSTVPELTEWSASGDFIRLGAGVPYARIISELGEHLPGLAMAARTVASPQIRNRGTVGGNLATASPSGDAHPALLACGAEVELASARGTRRMPVTEFFTGAKCNAAEPDELITAVYLARATGPQQFAKVGTRNAMVIAVCAFSVVLHPDRAGVGTGFGSAAPTPRRAVEAEAFLSGELTSRGMWADPQPLPDTVVARFGELVAAAAAPIDDVRGTASYRRHALGVLARRTVRWTWNEYLTGRQTCA